MPPRQGTGHINWGSFVNANRGSAERLAGQLLAPVNAKGEMGERILDEAQGPFQAQIEQGDERGVTSYQGPSSLAGMPNWAEGEEAARQASQGSRQLADIYGRQGLLASMYGATPGYGAGSAAFDAALLGSVGQGGFEGARKAYGGLSDAYRTALGQSATAATEAAQRARERGRNQPSAPPAPAAPDEDVWGGFTRGPQPDENVDAPWLNRPRKRKEGNTYG